MRGYLTVRIADGQADRHVTRWTRDLSFRKTVPGGHHSASMRLLLPRDTFRDLGPADKVYIYDARTTRTIWEGYTENPGVTDGPAGQEYDLSAMGGMVLASDESRPLYYIDRGLEAWELNYQKLAQMTASSSSKPDTEDVPGLLYQFPRGIAVSNDYNVSMRYDALKDAGLELGGFKYATIAGITDANYRIQALTEDGTLVRNVAASTAGVSPAASSAGSAFTVGQKQLRIRWIRSAGGATNIANDDTWAHISDLWVRMLLLTQAGVKISGPSTYANAYVLGSEVAADLLGRVLANVCDPASSSIETTLAQIDQLAYPDGATAQTILDDLALHEPNMLWEILESTTKGHRFNYRAWPTTSRYEISVKDGYEAPGGEIDLCNRVAVYWTNRVGVKKVTVVTANVPELGGDPATAGYKGRIRDAESVTLPEGLGSTANALRVGQQVLASKNTPPKSARAVVRRPIIDRLTGSTVMPWEIEPGYLVRVRETGDDLRLTEMEYADNDAATTLTLGTPTLSMDQLLAGLGGRK